jgi:YbgC/YbaW family acyl-CoA thioester hydrolase
MQMPRAHCARHFLLTVFNRELFMTLQRQDFRFFHRLRVRWVEVDMQQIVFNGHYVMYVDTAMGDYWRTLALPYQDAMTLLGGDTFVKKVTLEYHASARYDDVLHVGLRCQKIGNSSIVMEAGIFRANQLLVSGELLYVFADPATQTSRPVPQPLRDAFAALEAGALVSRTVVGPWTDVGKRVLPLRHTVFVVEQGISESLVSDDADHDAVHAGIENMLGQVVASGRLVQQAPGISKVGRMATHRMLRSAGYGLQVLRALLEVARQRGDTEVMLHAQVSAEGFYARQGFERRGAVFHEVGIAHQEMVLKLRD